MNYNKLGKFRVFGDVLRKYFKGQKIKVLEYGRLRNPDTKARRTDGWSTLEFSCSDSVTTVYSVDTNKKTIKACQKVIPRECRKKVKFATNVKQFGKFEVDLLFLDANNDPEQCMNLYKEGIKYLKPGGVVLIDDVFDKKGKKGNILIPYLREQGFKVEKVHPFALIKHG